MNLEDRLFRAWGKWNIKQCSDPQCGLAWLDPMPLQQDIANAYQTYYTHANMHTEEKRPLTIIQRLMRTVRNSYLAHAYGHNQDTISSFQKRLWPLAYFSLNGRVWLDSRVMYLQAPYKGRLLEIGAGSGAQLKELIEFGWDGEGVDSDAHAVENAVRKGLRVRCGTVEAQHYPDNTFDAILMNHVIEHVHDPLSLLRECLRILRPGGKLVIITPNVLSMGHRIFTSSWFPLDPPRHVRLYSPRSLQRTVEDAGFLTMQTNTTTRNANGIYWMSRSIRQTGTCVMSTVPGTFIRFMGCAMQFIEAMLLKLNPSIGEEIAVVVTKE